MRLGTLCAIKTLSYALTVDLGGLTQRESKCVTAKWN